MNGEMISRLAKETQLIGFRASLSLRSSVDQALPVAVHPQLDGAAVADLDVRRLDREVRAAPEVDLCLAVHVCLDAARWADSERVCGVRYADDAVLFAWLQRCSIWVTKGADGLPFSELLVDLREGSEEDHF